ncbi:hypothetical protein K4A83_03090 [Spirulina subsalsa FACHB-351]|uniref:Uncharacterized protein n=2 Tax=Spirulina subsalsa TaxID=54311 RepID=A0ABT3L2F0_9CYAN|nr:hypothetical protein [Spirulina subsalsa FACHB-351]
MLSLGVFLSFLGGATSPLLAQTNHNPSREGFQNNEVNSLFGNTEGLNPFDLIHRATMGNGRSLGDFRRDSNRQLNRASEEFRRLQLERMQQLQQPTESEALTTPDEE